MDTHTRKPVFTGAGVAITTPFSKNGEIDFELFGRFIDFQINNGTDAIIVCGTTGEASTLSDQEHRDAIQFVIDKVAKRIPVIAGTGSNDTAYAIELSQFAEAAGADGLLMVTPYYNKTTQHGLVAHYNYIADRVNVPIIVYNVPSRTGLNILPETYAELSRHPMINGAKEANGNIDALIKTLLLCPDDFYVWSGEDSLTVPTICLGGKGVISVLSNICPQQVHDMCALCFDDKYDKATEMQKKYYSLISLLFCETNPVPVKEALKLLGADSGLLRLPLVPMLEKNSRLLNNELASLGVKIEL